MVHFADCAVQATTRLIENELVAQDTMRLRATVPAEIARAVPGQFFMVRVPECNDPLIGRALALFDLSPTTASIDSYEHTATIDLVYLIKGKMTSRLATLAPGQLIELWGPLGNSFSTQRTDHLIMVAGGIGQTPFLTLGREALGRQQFGSLANRDSGYARRVTLCYGVRSECYLACVEQFKSAGIEVQIATEDGSIGPPRRVTATLEELLDRAPRNSTARIVCCGPEPMMSAVSHIAQRRSLPCEVSLETPMACGIGLCFTCVAKVGTPADWDYKRTCIEGPIFDARTIVWD